ncbi:MgtC/SapB family protein [Paenibacillus larvae]|nr:MgtC/SapB family protein [Paenibacillus larvae]MDT2239147.1 MgtC/SapB family protein [Paenibacillus larvae]MDT2275402.1 MgtC/SapB family protein [Paenibacillus larvae]MDT2292395.1 MgtC/SapB family protein [Paenibacillus larvae]MDT2304371.1 MgtC/SapB family protein [Paenibacillus larvae]
MQVVQFDMILRLLLAGVFGAMIGFERKSRLKEAGLRTHFLVAVGSALIMVVSKYGFLMFCTWTALNWMPAV